MAHRTVESPDVEHEFETDSPSLVRTILANWVYWLASLVLAILATVGYAYNVTAGPTDEFLFGGLAIVLFVAGVLRTLHHRRAE